MAQIAVIVHSMPVIEVIGEWLGVLEGQKPNAYPTNKLSKLYFLALDVFVCLNKKTFSMN